MLINLVRLSILIALVCPGCGQQHLENNDGVAPHISQNRPDISAAEVEELKKLAISGDVEASERLMIYVSESPEQYSADEIWYWVSVSAHNGSDFGIETYYTFAIRDCEGALLWYNDLLRRFGSRNSLETVKEKIDRHCPVS